MGPKKAFPLRLDPELYKALRRWADLELRSVNGQIEYILREAVVARGFLGKSARSQRQAEGGDDHVPV